eukprot:GHVR01128356.1.p2 GENE.GHVR01128356.1~~GHVR01128356.1.p2  ORF type:complete len:116 (+),score=26.73 GHVR01128356.1:701-1048(+)
MGRNHKKRSHADHRRIRRKHDLRRRTNDIDQAHEELNNPPKLMVDEELPGNGMFYCLPCSRHFVSELVLKEHSKTKTHKRRLRDATQVPYTQRDAESAAGMTHERQHEHDRMVDA